MFDIEQLLPSMARAGVHTSDGVPASDAVGANTAHLLIGPDVATWLEGRDASDTEIAWLLADRPAPSTADGPARELDSIAPGIELAAVLASIDVDELSGHDRVTVMKAHQRMASHHEALVYGSMARVADAVTDELGPGVDIEHTESAASAEIRAALRLTRRTADAELAMARDYQHRHDRVWEAFATGVIDRRRANLIVHRTGHLSEPAAREAARVALERAPELTTGQLTALLRKLSAEADRDESTRRYEAAVDDRRVVLESTADGTAHLYLLDLPPDRAVRIRDRIDAAARDLAATGETRTMDQLRADVVMDLLDPAADSADRVRRGALILTVDLDTLAGLADGAGDLGGYGPVIADIARRAADDSHDAQWRYVVTDGAGRPVSVGTTRRRPTVSDRRLIEAAYPTCIFPGCRAPAPRCDLDHTTPWANEGPTTPDNLAPLCRNDHGIRHNAGWDYQRTPDGDHEWITALGHHYTTHPRPP